MNNKKYLFIERYEWLLTIGWLALGIIKLVDGEIERAIFLFALFGYSLELDLERL